MLSNKTCHSLIGSDRRANESQHGSAACSKYYGELDTSLVTPTCCKTLNAIWLSLRDSGTAVSTEGSERHGEHLPQPQKPRSLRLRCARCCSPGFIPKKHSLPYGNGQRQAFPPPGGNFLCFHPWIPPGMGLPRLETAARARGRANEAAPKLQQRRGSRSRALSHPTWHPPLTAGWSPPSSGWLHAAASTFGGV